jgi:hypothetical protein
MKNPHGLTLATIHAAIANPMGITAAMDATRASAPV